MQDGASPKGSSSPVVVSGASWQHIPDLTHINQHNSPSISHRLPPSLCPEPLPTPGATLLIPAMGAITSCRLSGGWIWIKIDNADMLVVVKRHAGTCKRVRTLSGANWWGRVVGCLVSGL
jgi:hypothetical protein